MRCSVALGSHRHVTGCRPMQRNRTLSDGRASRRLHVVCRASSRGLGARTSHLAWHARPGTRRARSSRRRLLASMLGQELASVLAEMRPPCRQNARIPARDNEADIDRFNPAADRSGVSGRSIGGGVECRFWETRRWQRFKRSTTGSKSASDYDYSTSTICVECEHNSVGSSKSRGRRICGLVSRTMSSYDARRPPFLAAGVD